MALANPVNKEVWTTFLVFQTHLLHFAYIIIAYIAAVMELPANSYIA